MNAPLKVIIIFSLAAVAILPFFFTGPIPQPPDYHNFADQRAIVGIPGFWNVISNIPYLLIGITGIVFTLTKPVPGGLPELRQNYLLFFTGVFLLGLGSSWYHWSPSNSSLVWDRLPMTIAFMAFFSAIIGEYYSTRAGNLVLWPLIIVGMLSVFYWQFTEQAEHGDLRPYAAVQFLPMLLIPVIMLINESRFKSNRLLWWFMTAYLIAKFAEQYDTEIFDMVSISGHTLKHLISAAGIYLYYLALDRRILKTRKIIKTTGYTYK